MLVRSLCLIALCPYSLAKLLHSLPHELRTRLWSVRQLQEHAKIVAFSIALLLLLLLQAVQHVHRCFTPLSPFLLHCMSRVSCAATAHSRSHQSGRLTRDFPL